ncbi:hypothetical protein MGSAQ_003344 [marine sediment metagenome]|uniref:Uncharacterized protein n=1 Tax=marine sediment metagenome TaxID=412755 RepID=A0A1B6NP57_9ZZZZ
MTFSIKVAYALYLVNQNCTVKVVGKTELLPPPNM